VPVEFAASLYDALMEAGTNFGLGNAGYRAIETLRLEKGYRAWGSDIGPDHTPLEAGLGWAVKLKKPIPFLGREALQAQKAQGVQKLLTGFTTADPKIILLGRETIFRDDIRVGWLSSGGFGHSIGKPIGYGYVRHFGVDKAFIESGRWELEVATQRVACTPHLAPLWDPEMLRVKN